MNNYAPLLGWIGVTMSGGFVGSFVTRKNIPGWYSKLRKPRFNPPNWLFAPVWTGLYVMMGTSAWMVWKKGGFDAQLVPLSLYLSQLSLNFLWTPLFFGAHALTAALVDISALWLNIALTIREFHRVEPVASYLLVPYLGWVSYASYLNYSIRKLNKDKTD